MKLLFATQNKDKILEVKPKIEKLGISLISPYDLEAELGKAPDVEEAADTYEGNALLKAEAFFNWASIPAFSDDSGLEVEILDGGPGLYTARFAGEDCTYKDNCKKMITTLNDAGLDSSPAVFRSSICVFGLQPVPLYFTGVLEGKVINEERGSGGFGYDPMFVADGYTETLAELKSKGSEPKNHRVLALEAMFEFLSSGE